MWIVLACNVGMVLPCVRLYPENWAKREKSDVWILFLPDDRFPEFHADKMWVD